MLDLLVRRLGATRRTQGADAAVGSCKEWLCVFTVDRDTLTWFGAEPTKRELMMDSSSCEMTNDQTFTTVHNELRQQQYRIKIALTSISPSSSDSSTTTGA
jgi:hypothetical protein